MFFVVMVWAMLLFLGGACVALAFVVRALWRRLQAFERRLADRPRPTLAAPDPSPLHGLRIALDIAQDHPNPVFAGLLRDDLLKKGATVVPDAEFRIAGNVVCNGYADVYFRAELTVSMGEEPLFDLMERPPHGDRPENLVLELVERLEGEIRRRERQNAMGELGS